MDTFIRFLFALFVTYFITRKAYKKKSLSYSGCLAASLVGVFVTWSSLCHFATLLAFFYSSSKATRLKEQEKRRYDEHFKHGGQRNAIQVFCNGFSACLFSFLYVFECGVGEKAIDFNRNYRASFNSIAILASFSCACGDTLASEIGTAFADSSFNRTIHIIKWKRVPKGTNGGISLVGTCASILGGFLVGLAYYVTLKLILLFDDRTSPAQWPILVISTASGFFGSIIDSILGGLFQYSGFNRQKNTIVESPGEFVKHISGKHVLNNNQVNFLSIALIALVAPYTSCRWYKNL